MTDAPDKPRLRWWQFSLRKFLVVVALFSVLSVACWRYREWGRELAEERDDRFYWVVKVHVHRHPRERLLIENRHLMIKRQEFDGKYWLPMKVYELTSWDNEPEVFTLPELIGQPD